MIALLKDTEPSHRYGQAKISYGGLVFGSTQSLLLPQLPQKMMLASKVVKSDSKIIISLLQSKSMHTLSKVRHLLALVKCWFNYNLMPSRLCEPRHIEAGVKPGVGNFFWSAGRFRKELGHLINKMDFKVTIPQQKQLLSV